VPHEERTHELLAAVPSPERAAGLGKVARSIMASDRGRIVRQFSDSGDFRNGVTTSDVLITAGAVPLLQGRKPFGVLAVEKSHGGRICRGDLARLAVLAQRLGEALAEECSVGEDTRFGLAG